MRRLLVVPLLVLAVGRLLPSDLAADVWRGAEEARANPPVVNLLQPTVAIYTATANVQVDWCDNEALVKLGNYVKVNGVNQVHDYVAAMPYAGCGDHRTSTATAVSFNVGDNYVEAHICDDESNCTTATFLVVRYLATAPVIALKNFNADNQDRSLCLTIGAGQAAGLSCGDLMVGHALPTYRTMGRDRSLTLLYNSATAAPRPTVVAWISQVSGTMTPNSMYAELTVNGSVRASATYGAWGSGTVRQVALSFDAAAAGLATGVYSYTLLVRNQYPGTAQDASVSGELLVVNRSASEFGAGWWPAGVEQIFPGQSGNRILWVGGDGSAAVYNTAVTTWVRASGAYRDTLGFNAFTSLYTRVLRHGVSVVFDANGRHVQTIARSGATTTFTWTGSPARLTSIQVPPGGTGTTYSLGYTGGLVDSIVDPASRRLRATVSGGNLTALADPDNVAVQFVYDGARRLTSRTSRNTYSTWYTYGNGLHVTRVAIPLNPTVNDSARDSSRTRFSWWDERGLAIGVVGGTLTAADTADVYTQVFGPRINVADNATFWVDRWGAPIRIVGAVNDTTRLTRDASSGLVTMIRNPIGDSVTMTYDAGRGNLLTVTDQTNEGTGATIAVTTSYVYGNANVPDSPTEVRSPVDTTRYHYLSSLGVPDTVTAPGGAKTVFSYDTSGARRGLLLAVSSLGVNVVDTTGWTVAQHTVTTGFEYDSWGNDTAAVVPSGLRTYQLRDSARRVWRAIDAAGHATDYGYDAMGQVAGVTEGGLTTQYRYTRTGSVDTILDPRSVLRSWRYDAADRDTALIDDWGRTERRYFGPSGLLDSIRTRDSSTSAPQHIIRYSYDNAGRLTTTATNGFSDPRSCCGSAQIAADTIRWTYDLAGRPITIQRSRSQITRAYNREGTLRSERQLVKNSSGVTMSDFTVSWTYDAGSRRRTFFNGVDTQRYTYGVGGYLDSLIVQWATGQAPDTFRFTWDALGRRDSVLYKTPGVTLRNGYDADGRLRMVCSVHAGAGLDDSLSELVHYTSMSPDGMPLYIDNWNGGAGPGCASGARQRAYEIFEYDSRHQVVRDRNNRYAYDGSGNRTETRDLGSTVLETYLYNNGVTPPTNRLFQEQTPAGALIRTYSYHYSGSLSEDQPYDTYGNTRWHFYNDLGELTGVVQQVPGPNFVGTPNDCVYDAVGRRTAPCNGEGGGWLGFDGNNVTSEKVSGTVRWRFAHGPGVDDPLVGMYWNSGIGAYERYYYVTNGGGRLLAFTNQSGVGQLATTTYSSNGGNQAGAISASNTFANARANSASVPSLSFYRNRYYDQYSGRWSQEDPAGAAGSVNLYQYAGNNPVTFTDPFGMLVDIRDDDSRAVIAYLRRTSRSFDRLYRQIEARRGFTLVISRVEGRGNRADYDRRTNTTTVSWDVSEVNDMNARSLRNPPGPPRRPFIEDIGSAVGHEVGHAGADAGFLPRACGADPNPGSGGCIVDFENRIRHESLGPGVTPRPFY